MVVNKLLRVNPFQPWSLPSTAFGRPHLLGQWIRVALIEALIDEAAGHQPEKRCVIEKNVCLYTSIFSQNKDLQVEKLSEIGYRRKAIKAARHMHSQRQSSLASQQTYHYENADLKELILPIRCALLSRFTKSTAFNILAAWTNYQTSAEWRVPSEPQSLLFPYLPAWPARCSARCSAKGSARLLLPFRHTHAFKDSCSSRAFCRSRSTWSWHIASVACWQQC